MLAYVTQQGIDDFVADREMRIAADLVDPMRDFPGEVWCDGNWTDLRISGYDFIDFVDLLDPHVVSPSKQRVTPAVLAEAQPNMARTLLHLSSTSVSATQAPPTITQWSQHLNKRKASPTFLPCLPQGSAVEKGALQNWSALAPYRAPSTFAILVDPYLFHNDNKAIGNLSNLIASTVHRLATGEFVLLVVCKWTEEKQGQVRSLVDEDTPEKVAGSLRPRSFKSPLTIHFVDADDWRLKLAGTRLHDRYLLTQHYLFTSGAGFSDPSKRKNFSEIATQYHAGSRASRSSFNHRLAEVAAYLAACDKSKEQSIYSYSDLSVAASVNPGAIRKQMLARVADAVGPS